MLNLRSTFEETTRGRVTLTKEERMRHVVVLGKTGSGKSYLLRHMSAQDVAKDRGFVYFDLHGDATPFLLQTIHARERREHRHLSDKLIVIDPADPIMSVGLNPLEEESPDFIRIAEVAEILKRHWALDHFGARTDELLRNTLYALSVNGLTLVEIVPFLANGAFRAACLARVPNAGDPGESRGSRSLAPRALGFLGRASRMVQYPHLPDAPEKGAAS